MTVSRITPNIMLQRTLANLNAQQRRLFDLQQQLATGQRVNVPSDDPLASRRAVEGRAEIAKSNQYLDNIAMAGLHMHETETSLMTLVDLLQRANELTLQASNHVNAELQLGQIAQEINQLLEGIFSESNVMSNGRYVFGGNRTTTPPFEATRDANGDITQVSFVGNGEAIEMEINDGIRIKVNESGNVIFGQIGGAAVDIFQALIDARDNMRNDQRPELQTRLEEINGSISQILVAIARTGATQNRLDRTDENLRANILQVTQVVSDSVEADFAEVTLNLNLQLNAYQAALNAGARIIQPSLMDFLR